MEILDLSNVGSDVPSYVRDKMEPGLDQPLTQILLNPNANYSWYLAKGGLHRYNIAYNEYEGGLYLGSKDNPYLCFIQPKDDKVATLIVHPDCRLVCQFAFHQHPNLTNLSIAAEDKLNIAHDAFSQCPKLQSVSFNCKGHVFLRYSVFQNCPNLEHVRFDEVAQYEFSGHLFASCPKLTRFEFPKGIAQDYVQNRAYDVFQGTPIERLYLPKSLSVVENWFEPTTKVYCELDPKRVASSYHEEEEFEPYHDYYHPGGTHTLHISDYGGANFFGPMTRSEYEKLFPES